MSRDSTIDILRAIGVLWIVGFFHLLGYTTTELPLPVSSYITLSVLSSFVFVSGMLIGKRRLDTATRIKDFYQRRFFHAYLPFLMACFIAAVEHFLIGSYLFRSVQNFLFSIIGLSSVITPSTPTLWFICMMFFFYAVTPILKWRNGVIYAIGLFIISFVCHVVFGLFDERVLWYYPFYVTGLNWENIRCSIRFEKMFLMISSVVFMLEVFFNRFLPPENGIQFLIAPFGICSLWTISKYLDKIYIARETLKVIGRMSMSIYLFHRQIYSLISYIYGKQKWSLSFAYLGALPICFAVSYAIDVISRKLIKRLECRFVKTNVVTGNS